METYIVTGATSGLGMQIAASLAQMPATRVVLAVRNPDKGKRTAARIGRNVEVTELDLARLSDIDRFISAWQAPVKGLVNNAGVQIHNETRFTTPEGFEETFAVNHMAALKLTLGMLPFLDGGRVLFIGSGTHHPHCKSANLFGFRGAQFKSVRACAQGLDEKGPIARLGMDRYATSKFLNTVTPVELARRIPAGRTAFFCLDPGMMAGTKLARTAKPPIRFAWSYILPHLSGLLPDTSTPKKSGETAAWIMTHEGLTPRTGTVFSFDRSPSRQVWDPVWDDRLGKKIIDDSLAMMGLSMPAAA